jgi:serine/threonine protein kinase
VTAYHATRLAGRVVYSMEYVEGLDLARRVKANGPLPVGDACHFVHQAALGLQHAHEQGLVHRDIKPGNLMLTWIGGRATVKLLDFGLAKASRSQPVDDAITSVGQAIGTPDYMAPEQIRNAPNVDIRADIYSLGGTLYYLLTGSPPFRAQCLYEIYQGHLSREAEPLNRVRPDVPAELAAIVAKMMAKDPAARFQTPAKSLGPWNCSSIGRRRGVEARRRNPSRRGGRSGPPPCRRTHRVRRPSRCRVDRAAEHGRGVAGDCPRGGEGPSGSLAP